MPRPWVIIYPSKKKEMHFLALCLQLPCWKYWVLSSCIKNKKDSWLEWRQNPGGLAGVVAANLAEESVPFCDITKGSFSRTSYFRTTGKAEKVPVEYEQKNQKTNTTFDCTEECYKSCWKKSSSWLSADHIQYVPTSDYIVLPEASALIWCTEVWYDLWSIEREKEREHPPPPFPPPPPNISAVGLILQNMGEI